MQVFNLPQDIFPGKKENAENIIFYDYSPPAGSFKGRSILHKNAISLVISGEKTMHFADKTVYVKDDEFHFLSAGNCVASMKLSDKKAFRSILIFFDDKVLADFHIKYHALIKKISSRKKISNQLYVAFQKDAFVLNFIQSLSLIFRSKTAISAEMKLLKFEELMLHLLETYPDKILSFQPATNKNFDDLEIRRAVETNITNNISVEEMAFLCNTSLSTFKRRFSEIYGTSPNKWILQQRMAMAKDLLTNNHEKPGEVYHKVGYENHSSFTQVFKQTFGVTPKEFQLRELNVQQ
jgi:AraC-like DNA-binding protein